MGMGWQESTSPISLQNQEKLVRAKTEQSKVLVTHFPFHLSANQETAAAAVLWWNSKEGVVQNSFWMSTQWWHGHVQGNRQDCEKKLLPSGWWSFAKHRYPAAREDRDTGNAAYPDAVHAFLKTLPRNPAVFEMRRVCATVRAQPLTSGYTELINFRIWIEGFKLHQWGEGSSEVHK